MPTHTVVVTRSILLRVGVQFEAEFDDETGEATVASDGAVGEEWCLPTPVPRDDITRRTQRSLGIVAYAALIAAGDIEVPQIGEVVTLNGKKYVFNPTDGEFPTDPHLITPENLRAALDPMEDASARFPRRWRRR